MIDDGRRARPIKVSKVVASGPIKGSRARHLIWGNPTEDSGSRRRLWGMHSIVCTPERHGKYR